MAFLAPIAAFAASNIGTIGTVLSVATAGLSAVNAMQAGQYQAAIAKSNAATAQRNAAARAEAAQREAQRHDIETASQVGTQEAVQAASGLDVLGRTQLQTRNLTRMVGRQEAGDIVGKGVGEARQLLGEAANFRSEAQYASSQGKINAFGSLLEGGRQLANDLGATRSLATSRFRKKFPWEVKP